MDDRGVVVVEIVSPKEEERNCLGVPYDFESSLSLPYVLIRWLVLWSNPADTTSFSPVEESGALLCWVCIEVSKHGGKTTIMIKCFH